jgi:hypothetical protein
MGVAAAADAQADRIERIARVLEFPGLELAK